MARTLGCDDGMECISADRFACLLNEYEGRITRQLQELNNDRFETIPRQIRQRVDKPHITKPELVRLMDWKLAHGKFRPTLKKLISQNEPEAVIQASEAGLAQFCDLDLPRRERVTRAIASLTALRGVGPATASLVLATSISEDAVFFSDQLYWWTAFCASDANVDLGRSTNAKYNLKEYLEIDAQVLKLRQRLQVTSSDVEKVAYVLYHSHISRDYAAPLERVSHPTDLPPELSPGIDQNSSKKRRQSYTGNDETRSRLAKLRKPK